ncbi:MAG: hypothetical protein Q9197_003239 [Variospora fuerteventurae]
MSFWSSNIQRWHCGIRFLPARRIQLSFQPDAGYEVAVRIFRSLGVPVQDKNAAIYGSQDAGSRSESPRHPHPAQPYPIYGVGTQMHTEISNTGYNTELRDAFCRREHAIRRLSDNGKAGQDRNQGKETGKGAPIETSVIDSKGPPSFQTEEALERTALTSGVQSSPQITRCSNVQPCYT